VRAAKYAKSEDSTTWSGLQEAQTAATAVGIEGIGLQLLELAGFSAIDLDNVRSDGRDLLPWARELINASASYAEFTPSGNGARILGSVPRDLARLHIGKTRIRTAANSKCIHSPRRGVASPFWRNGSKVRRMFWPISRAPSGNLWA